MDSKYISVLIICLLLSMVCMGTVCAKSMKTQDFGDFKMDVPTDSNFAEQAMETDEDDDFSIKSELYIDNQNQIMVMNTNSSIISQDNSYMMYTYMFDTVNMDLEKSYEYQDGNLRIIEPVSDSELYFSLVGISLGNNTIMLFGNDVNQLKNMAKTAELNS